MKKVIKYESENGNLFETEKKARREDLLYEIERIIEQHEDAIIPDKRQATLSIVYCVLKYVATSEDAKQFISDNKQEYYVLRHERS